MTTTHKTTRSQQIAAVIETVAKYYNVDAGKVLTSFAPKNPDVVRARVLVWHHLHKGGMSFLNIGRIFGGLSVDNVQRRTKQGAASLTAEDVLLLATLPRIQTTIEIFRAELSA